LIIGHFAARGLGSSPEEERVNRPHIVGHVVVLAILSFFGLRYELVR